MELIFVDGGISLVIMKNKLFKFKNKGNNSFNEYWFYNYNKSNYINHWFYNFIKYRKINHDKFGMFIIRKNIKDL